MDQLPDTNRTGVVPAERPIKEQIARGIAWMTAARMGVQFLGLLSTMILARLLSPADFGLIALAMSVIALLEALTSFGFETPLIHKQDATRDDFDSAWTLNILLAAVVCLGIVLVAPLAASFYVEPRIETILYWVAAGHFCLAFQNIGTVKFRKQLNFSRDFSLQVAQKIAMLAVTIPLAFAMRSYWALVAGMVAGNVAAVGVSYLFLPYRPRFCLGSWRELFSYSKWLQVNSVFRYLRDRGSTIVMGRLLDAPAVGIFSLANEIASLPATALVQPLNRAMLPGYVRLSSDAERLRDGYKSILGLIALVTVPATVGVASVAALIVPVALGTKWQATVPLLTLLALSGTSRSLTASTVSVHYATGQPHQQTLTTGIQAFTLLPLVAFAINYHGLIGAAWAYFLHSALVFMPICYWILLRTTPIRLSDLWDPLWRPLVAAAAMFAAIWPLAQAWASPEALVALPRLLLLVGAGALLYLGSVALLWRVSGRPEGAETALLRRLGPKLQRLLPRDRL
jgi:lipopolysaccharide exporter